MLFEIESSEELVLSTVLLYSIIIMAIILWHDRKLDKEKLEKIARREKALKNTKDEAIRESQEPLLIQKIAEDVEVG